MVHLQAIKSTRLNKPPAGCGFVHIDGLELELSRGFGGAEAEDKPGTRMSASGT